MKKKYERENTFNYADHLEEAIELSKMNNNLRRTLLGKMTDIPLQFPYNPCCSILHLSLQPLLPTLDQYLTQAVLHWL